MAFATPPTENDIFLGRVQQYVDSLGALPVILAGDFNACYQAGDATHCSPVLSAMITSGRGLDPSGRKIPTCITYRADNMIDFMFVNRSAGQGVVSSEVLCDSSFATHRPVQMRMKTSGLSPYRTVFRPPPPLTKDWDDVRTETKAEWWDQALLTWLMAGDIARLRPPEPRTLDADWEGWSAAAASFLKHMGGERQAFLAAKKSMDAASSPPAPHEEASPEVASAPLEQPKSQPVPKDPGRMSNCCKSQRLQPMTSKGTAGSKEILSARKRLNALQQLVWYWDRGRAPGPLPFHMLTACEKAHLPIPASLRIAKEQLTAHRQVVKDLDSAAKKEHRTARSTWFADTWRNSIGKVFAWARGQNHVSLSAVVGSDGT